MNTRKIASEKNNKKTTYNNETFFEYMQIYGISSAIHQTWDEDIKINIFKWIRFNDVRLQKFLDDVKMNKQTLGKIFNQTSCNKILNLRFKRLEKYTTSLCTVHYTHDQIMELIHKQTSNFDSIMDFLIDNTNELAKYKSFNHQFFVEFIMKDKKLMDNLQRIKNFITHSSNTKSNLETCLQSLADKYNLNKTERLTKRKERDEDPVISEKHIRLNQTNTDKTEQNEQNEQNDDFNNYFDIIGSVDEELLFKYFEENMDQTNNNDTFNLNEPTKKKRGQYIKFYQTDFDNLMQKFQIKDLNTWEDRVKRTINAWATTNDAKLNKIHEEAGIDWESMGAIFDKHSHNGPLNRRLAVLTKYAASLRDLKYTSKQIIDLACTHTKTQEEIFNFLLVHTHTLTAPNTGINHQTITNLVVNDTTKLGKTDKLFRLNKLLNTLKVNKKTERNIDRPIHNQPSEQSCNLDINNLQNTSASFPIINTIYNEWSHIIECSTPDYLVGLNDEPSPLIVNESTNNETSTNHIAHSDDFSLSNNEIDHLKGNVTPNLTSNFREQTKNLSPTTPSLLNTSHAFFYRNQSIQKTDPTPNEILMTTTISMNQDK